MKIYIFLIENIKNNANLLYNFEKEENGIFFMLVPANATAVTFTSDRQPVTSSTVTSIVHEWIHYTYYISLVRILVLTSYYLIKRKIKEV